MILYFLIISFEKKIFEQDLRSGDKFSLFNRNLKNFLTIDDSQIKYFNRHDQNFYLEDGRLVHKNLHLYSENDVIHLSYSKPKHHLKLKFLDDDSHNVHILNEDNKCLGGEIFRNDIKECDVFEVRKNKFKNLVKKVKNLSLNRNKKHRHHNTFDTVNTHGGNDLEHAFTKLKNAYCDMVKHIKRN